MNMQTGEYSNRRGRVEIPEFVNRRTLEAAYARVLREQTKRDNHVALKALRIANDHGSAAQSKMLRALEGGAEVLHQMAEEQVGRTTRDSGSSAGEKVWATEAQFFRDALVTLDKGTPLDAFAWFYATAAILAGLV